MTKNSLEMGVCRTIIAIIDNLIKMWFEFGNYNSITDKCSNNKKNKVPNPTLE